MLVPVRNGDIERALRTLKRKLQKEGYFRDVRERGFYKKPSQKKRKKHRDAERRRMKGANRRL